MVQSMMSQAITDKEMVRMKTNQLFFKSHGLDLVSYDFSQPALNQELNLALICHNKKRTNTIFSAVFFTAGIINFISAATADNGKNISNQTSGNQMVTENITSGIIGCGLSVPFFISAKKRSREMHLHLALAKEMYGQ